MDNSTLQKIKDLIDKNDRIGIAVGKNPTIDSMAAALSLSLGLLDYGKQAAVASASQPLVEHSSLVGIDKVKSNFDGSATGDLVVSFPYREGEIEKVSYTIEGGYLNIVVKAGEAGLTFSESDVKFRQGGGGAPSLLFIIGTPHLSDLGRLFDTEALKNTTIVNIDNKPENQGYGDVPAVMMNSASVSELIANLLYYLGIDPSVDVAQNVLNGINDGSSNMQDPRVSYTTFELVANLMKKGAARAQAPQQPPMPRPQQRMPQPFGQPRSQQGQYSRPPMPRPQMPQRPGGFQRPNQMPRRDQYDQSGGRSFTGQYPQDSYVQQPMPSRFPQPDMTQQGYEQPENPQPEMPRRDQSQQRNNQPRRDHGQDRKPPSDWLTPKVYKGSQPPEEN